MDQLIEACNLENVVLQVVFPENVSIVSVKSNQLTGVMAKRPSLLVMHGSAEIQQLRKQKVL